MYSTFKVGLETNEIQFTIQEGIFKFFILYGINLALLSNRHHPL